MNFCHFFKDLIYHFELVMNFQSLMLEYGIVDFQKVSF